MLVLYYSISNIVIGKPNRIAALGVGCWLDGFICFVAIILLIVSMSCWMAVALYFHFPRALLFPSLFPIVFPVSSFLLSFPFFLLFSPFLLQVK